MVPAAGAGEELYVAGEPWLVRKGTQFGSAPYSYTWTTVDDISYDSGVYNRFARMDADSGGNIYAVGYGPDKAADQAGKTLGNGKYWLVRKGTKTSSGMTWANVDAFPIPYQSGAMAVSVACAADDSVWVAGREGDGDLDEKWIVRKSTPGGRIWSISDAPLRADGYRPVQGITFSPEGFLYTSGTCYVSNPDKISYWLVRRLDLLAPPQ